MKRLAAAAFAAVVALAGADSSADAPVGEAAYFGSSSASVTADGFGSLHALAEAMKADPMLRVEVAGHADTSGPDELNMQLSRQRAVVVREFLVAYGVDPGRLVARAYGETRPVNDNSTRELRSWNRRVQFRRVE
ncbi:MAG: OmpA family protein [Gammaproteobacteria bacterium]